MAISLVRIDERLIHGQVAHSWTVEYGIDTIMVVDDEASKNSMLKMMLEFAVPPKKKFLLFDREGAVEFFKHNEASTEKIFIVVKNPTVPLYLVEKGVNIKSINVGGMYFVPGKKQLTKTVYVNDEDVTVFKNLQKCNVECEIRTSPKDKSVDIYGLI